MTGRGGRILRSNPWRRLITAIILSGLAAVAILATIADLAAARAAQGVTGRIGADETVVVWSHGLESADAAAARASEILAKVPGVKRAQWLDPAPGDSLVAAALGAPGGQDADDRLISVTAPGGGRPLADRITKALAEQDLPAKAMNRSGMARSGAETPALAAAVLIPLVAILVFALGCWVETRREMARGHAVIDLMRSSGAYDGFIAAEVRRRISGLALVTALWGASAAMVAAAIVARKGYAGIIGGLTRQDLLTPWPALIPVLWLAGLAGAALSARGRLKTLT